MHNHAANKFVFSVTPAQAGVQKNRVHVFRLDSRLRGNDGVQGTLQFVCSLRVLRETFVPFVVKGTTKNTKEVQRRQQCALSA